ncbi:helix-turn-helix domain-containing protein [Legionella sp. MW5194]|uniref:helix-turn-helix domain-containing protein n=1 Tax=Legionella sp. MW5194 TaxID=2662448 RepID=UPI00193C8CD9|nr:AraC family transcriptional regulator [Legionella sp. MW5194]QRN03281.1 helix-turn-helix domain-containing protein [Legionella sp. MW5194]
MLTPHADSLSHPALELRHYSKETHSHSHAYAQYVFPLQGSLEIEINHRGGLLTENRAAFIAPSHQHGFAGSEDNLFLVMDLPQPPRIATTQPAFLTINPMLGHLLKFIHHYLLQNTRHNSTQAIVQTLLAALNEDLKPLLDQRVLLAKQWIDRHYREPISLARPAAYCHLSVSQLQRRFKQAMGQTLGQYWRDQRLLAAQTLMTTSPHSLQRIAMDVGYENLAAFSRAFLAWSGTSPRQWRHDFFSKANAVSW